MKHILLVMAVVMGQAVLAADKKPLIADPIVEKAVRSKYSLNKPIGELTKADLGKVASLNLSYAKITDAGLKEVGKLQQLTYLNLQFAKITDEGLKELAKLQQLTFLYLLNTQITITGVAELQKALPKCKIRSNATK